jgi:BTB/POZ domain
MYNDDIEESHILWSEEEGTGEDQEALYSDWTIKIQSSQDGATLERTFHVHRMMFGSKSPYFHALFKGNFAENKVVTLAFPDLVVVQKL